MRRNDTTNPSHAHAPPYIEYRAAASVESQAGRRGKRSDRGRSPVVGLVLLCATVLLFAVVVAFVVFGGCA